MPWVTLQMFNIRELSCAEVIYFVYQKHLHIVHVLTILLSSSWASAARSLSLLSTTNIKPCKTLHTSLINCETLTNTHPLF